LDALASEDGASESSPGRLSSLAHLRSHYEDKLRQVMAQRDGVEEGRDTVIYQRIQTDVLNAERAAVIHLRDQGRIDDDVLRTIERKLHLEDQRLRRA
jgi:monovalent cation/hydrogen antiporter